MITSNLIPSSITSFSIPKVNLNNLFTETKAKRAALKALQIFYVGFNSVVLYDSFKSLTSEDCSKNCIIFKTIDTSMNMSKFLFFTTLLLGGSYCIYKKISAHESQLKDFDDPEEVSELRKKALTSTLRELEESYRFYGGLDCLIDKKILTESELELKYEEHNAKEYEENKDLLQLLFFLEKFAQVEISSNNPTEKPNS